MKFDCHCGEVIYDSTDDLPYKGYLIPDQAWFSTYDTIDNEVIDPLTHGRIGQEMAYHLARQIISRSARCMWQCQACGRLYIDGLDDQLQCFLPEGEAVDREILRGQSKHT